MTGRDVRTAYEAMGLRRPEAADLIGVSETRLAAVEQDRRPLFTLFNWEVLAALGNEHHRREDEAGLPDCDWIDRWAAESFSDEAITTESEEKIAAAEEERRVHVSGCDICRVTVEWSETNPDPIGFLFPAADRRIDRVGRWIPFTALILSVVAGAGVADVTGNPLFHGVGAVLGFAMLYGLQKARRKGYLP